MKAIIFDGSSVNDSTGERIRTALMAQLQNRGWDVEHVVLRDKKIGPCAGDFFCWVRNPGVCNINDDNRALAAAIIASDLMVYLTPVTFGGYSSVLKKMVDHQLQNVLPFFITVKGETHHGKRYKKYPDFLAVGWMDTADAQAETIFRHLAQRNAINFYTRTYVSGIVLKGQSDGEIADLVQNCLNELQNGHSSQPVRLPSGAATVNRTAPIQRALLLVGSPRTHKSTSNSLGEYLFERLGAQSVRTETIYLHTVTRSPARIQAMLDAVDGADLVTLAFPLYIDSLPAPVIEVLERIAAHRKGRETRRQLFTAIANSGFPEVRHNATALAICETFARQAGFEWAGSLALGGGEMISGVPLTQCGGKTIRIRKSLDLAATALVQGQAIPQAARELMGKPVIPHWAYRQIGGFGWKKKAKSYGAKKLLKKQPYLAQAG